MNFENDADTPRGKYCGEFPPHVHLRFYGYEPVKRELDSHEQMRAGGKWEVCHFLSHQIITSDSPYDPVGLSLV